MPSSRNSTICARTSIRSASSWDDNGPSQRRRLSPSLSPRWGWWGICRRSPARPCPQSQVSRRPYLKGQGKPRPNGAQPARLGKKENPLPSPVEVELGLYLENRDELSI